MPAATFQEIMKYNHNHDSLGRFSSTNGGGGGKKDESSIVREGIYGNGLKYTAGGDTYTPGGTYGEQKFKIPPSNNPDTVTSVLEKNSSGFIGEGKDAKFVQGKSNPAILDGGVVVIKNTTRFGGDGKTEIQDMLNAEVQRLAGIRKEGVFYRGTNNKNELSLLENGTLRNSYNHISGQSEKGVSVSNDALRSRGWEYCYKVTGTVVGYGSDGEPLLDPKSMKVLGGLSKEKYYNDAIKKMQKGREKFCQKYNWTEEQLRNGQKGYSEEVEFKDVATPIGGETKKSFTVYKADDDKHLVFGWASVILTVDGEILKDRQDDIIDPEDLEEAAYEYVLNFRDAGEEHLPGYRKKGKLIESCVFTKEKQKAMGLPDGILPVGWWIGFKIEDEDTWQRVKNGTYKMFSIEGRANREPVEKKESVAKSFNEILKFNPYHDSLGRFASSNSYSFFTIRTKDPNKQHWADKAVAREQEKEKAAAPKKPQVNHDEKGFADYSDADFHQLYNRKEYFKQQQLTDAQKKAADSYVNPDKEPGSLYNVAQNLNWNMVHEKPLTDKQKQIQNNMLDAMHNLGHNVNLTRYDHSGMVDSMLQAVGAGSDYRKLNIDQIKNALVGKHMAENKFISTTTNDFDKAPTNVQNLFKERAVKVNYKAPAGVQGLLMPIGAGGDQGELVLAPTSGANKAPRIADIRFTGKTVYRMNTGQYYPQIEIDLEWD